MADDRVVELLERISDTLDGIYSEMGALRTLEKNTEKTNSLLDDVERAIKKLR